MLTLDKSFYGLDQEVLDIIEKTAKEENKMKNFPNCYDECEAVKILGVSECDSVCNHTKEEKMKKQKRKLLVVNLQDPSKSHYRNYKEVATWLLGRRLSNYMLICVKDGIGYEIKIHNYMYVHELERSLILHFSDNMQNDLERFERRCIENKTCCYY